MTENYINENLIEARKVIRERLQVNRIGLQMWREADRDILAMRKAEAALAVFEKAYAPTDDERCCDHPKCPGASLCCCQGKPGEHGGTIPLYGMLDVWMALYGTSHPEFDEFYAEHGYADTWARILAAVRAHRTVQGEPSDAQVRKVAHTGPGHASGDAGYCEGCLAEREPQGEPTDEQVLAARRAYNDAPKYRGMDLTGPMRAALRAAAAVREEGQGHD